MDIRDMSEAARLEQLAEEARELTGAASHRLEGTVQKLARILRDESPTPASEEEERLHFYEEVADVLVCIKECVPLKDMPIINDMCVRKLARWKERLKGAGRINGTSHG